MKAARWIGARAFTLGLYVCAVVGGRTWDQSPDSWRLIGFRLVSAGVFLWWAVDRTIRHHAQDAADLDR